MSIFYIEDESKPAKDGQTWYAVLQKIGDDYHHSFRTDYYSHPQAIGQKGEAIEWVAHSNRPLYMDYLERASSESGKAYTKYRNGFLVFETHEMASIAAHEMHADGYAKEPVVVAVEIEDVLCSGRAKTHRKSQHVHHCARCLMITIL